MRATLVAAFGRSYAARLDDGRIIECFPRGKKSTFACGDEVEVTLSNSNQGVISALIPRKSLLYRSDLMREKLIASNVTQIVIVVATEPAFSDELISRALVAARSQSLRSCIVVNKADLAEKLPIARRMLAAFSQAADEMIELCALEDVSVLKRSLTGQISVLVGQSGMGKSTLTNALVPEAQAATREISSALGSGKHTTTGSRLYALEGGGALIDSPGLQVFGLAHLQLHEILAGFDEFTPYLGRCRFRDCQHDQEPGCALLAAREAGEIPSRRFAHFQVMRDEWRVAQKRLPRA